MSFQKETARTWSRSSGASSPKIRDASPAAASAQGRPSMLSKAYNTVSFRGSKVGGGVKNSFVGGGKLDTVSSEPKVLRSFSGVFATPVAGCRPDAPQTLTKEQTTKYEQALKYFTELADYPVSLRVDEKKREPATEWEKCRMLTRESILRYLRASKWDVAMAQRRLVETVAWRREFGVDSLDPDEMAKEAKSGKETVLGYDNHARPLHYMHPHRNDTKETPRQMQFAVWILEAAIDLMPPGVEQLALLINFEHRSRNPTSIANAKLMLDILQNRYVERLGVAMCINVPWVFKMFWNAIQAFIDPVTKSKCKFDEAIKSEVPLDQLADDFGGDLDAKYNHDAYWPRLVELCQQRRREMLARFKSECNSEIGAPEWVIRGGNDETSPFNVKDREALASSFPGGAASALGIGSTGSPEDARQQAIDSSEKRMAGATSNGNADATTNDTDTLAIPQTPMETYKTPSETINSDPLDRTFSNVSAHAALAVGVAGGTPMQIAAASRESKAEAEGKQEHKKRQSMEQEIKNLRDKMHDSKAWQDLTRTFHPRGSGEHKRKDSSEAKRRLSKDINGQAPESEVTSSEKTAGAAGAAVGAGAIAVGSAAATANGVNGDHAGANGSVKKPVKVLFFAAARDAAGTGSESVEVPSDKAFNLQDLATALVEKRRSAGNEADAEALQSIIHRSKWSVDEAMVDDNDKRTLVGGEEVGLIPPVSGG